MIPSQIDRSINIRPDTKQTLLNLRKELEINYGIRNKWKKCPLCGSTISDRRVTLYHELIDSLYEIYRWCGQNHKHEFEMSEIKSVLTKNNYARFGDLVRFGGIVYKPKDVDGESHKGWYGLNMRRAREFFMGEREIPVQITLNQITNEIIDAHYVKINEFPDLRDLINKEGLYDYEKLF